MCVNRFAIRSVVRSYSCPLGTEDRIYQHKHCCRGRGEKSFSTSAAIQCSKVHISLYYNKAISKSASDLDISL